MKATYPNNIFTTLGKYIVLIPSTLFAKINVESRCSKSQQ